MATFLVASDGALVEASATNRPRVADNGEMRSSTMGCATRKGQAKRLKLYARKGIDARFHPKTGELLYQGGYAAQKRLKNIHGLEID